jgi:hypothetical protein
MHQLKYYIVTACSNVVVITSLIIICININIYQVFFFFFFFFFFNREMYSYINTYFRDDRHTFYFVYTAIFSIHDNNNNDKTTQTRKVRVWFP